MKKIIVLLFTAYIVTGCNKQYVETDPATGQETSALSNNASSICDLIGFQQIDGSTIFNKLLFTKDSAKLPVTLVYFDSVNQKTDKLIRFTYSNGIVNINNNEWMALDPVSKNITKYNVRQYYADSTFDNEFYEYVYNDLNELVNKYTYLNGTKTPDYITNYQYDNSKNLVKCELFLSDGKTKLLQTDIKYDLSKTIKPWIYLYGDSFENYLYLQGFNFGVKPVNPVAEMTTVIFDVNSGNVFDTWKTSFNAYVFSKDSYVLQVNSTGDLQQGLGLFLGTNRFNYACN